MEKNVLLFDFGSNELKHMTDDQGMLMMHEHLWRERGMVFVR